tara:strand:+ start:249 stop:716 length:468 start_codon:yes stop_codon:yes gene_type:complete
MSESLSSFDNQDNSNLIHDERPVLLKVLCILSWLGSGIQIFSSTLYSSFINETVKQEFLALLPNKEVVDMYEKLFILLDSTSIWYVILYLINIAVVHMMWNFKLNGYFGYIFTQILILLVPFTVNPFSISQLAVSSIFPIIFIFLYGLNMKLFKR